MSTDNPITKRLPLFIILFLLISIVIYTQWPQTVKEETKYQRTVSVKVTTAKLAKFKDAIAVIDATQCETCHQEHKGVRVALPDANYCINCHSDLKVHKDPLDIPHETLISQGQWSTCLQCHDFHGNHVYLTPEKMKDTIPLSKIQEYLKGGEDPFSKEKKYMPLSEEEWLKLKKEYEE